MLPEAAKNRQYVTLSPQQVQEMLDRHLTNKRTVSETCKLYRISETTFYNHRRRVAGAAKAASGRQPIVKRKKRKRSKPVMRKSTIDVLQDPLLNWAKQRYRGTDRLPTLVEVQKHALKLSALFLRQAMADGRSMSEKTLENLQNFRASKGWASKWIRNHKALLDYSEGAKNLLGFASQVKLQSLGSAQNDRETWSLRKSIKIGDAEGRVVASSLRLSSNCRKLVFSDNDLTIDAFRVIHGTLREKSSVSTLAIHRNSVVVDSRFLDMICQLQHLETLILWECGLDDDGATKLATTLIEHPNSHLTTLILTRNKVGPKGANAIGKALVPEKQPKLTCLSLDNNEVGYSAVPNEFFKMLSVNTSLHRLHVDDNGLGDECCRALAKNHKSSIFDLKVAKNGITDVGIGHLSNFIGHNANLEFLMLSGNKMTKRGVRAFFASVKARWCGRLDVSIPKLQLAIRETSIQAHIHQLMHELTEEVGGFLEVVDDFYVHERLRSYELEFMNLILRDGERSFD